MNAPAVAYAHCHMAVEVVHLDKYLTKIFVTTIALLCKHLLLTSTCKSVPAQYKCHY